MRTPTAPLVVAGLLFLALTAFAINSLIGSGNARAASPAARYASHLQEGAKPLPGTRCTREKGERCKQRAGDQNNAPTVEIRASEQKITLGCTEGATSRTCTPGAGAKVQLQSNAVDPDGDTLLYTYSVTGGRASGDGAEATWDLTGARPGTYTANVEVDDCCGCVAFASVQVKVEACNDCDAPLR